MLLLDLKVLVLVQLQQTLELDLNFTFYVKSLAWSMQGYTSF